MFGIAAVVPPPRATKRPEAMAQKAIEYMAEAMREAGSFKGRNAPRGQGLP